MLAGNLEHQRVAQTVFHSFLNFSSRNFGPVKSHLHKNARFDVTILTKARIYAPLSPFLVLFGVRRKPLNFHLVFTTSGKVPAQSKPQVLTIKDIHSGMPKDSRKPYWVVIIDAFISTCIEHPSFERPVGHFHNHADRYPSCSRSNVFV